FQYRHLTVSLNALMNQLFAALDSQCQLSAYECAFQTVHGNPYICAPHEGLCKQIFQSEAESAPILPRLNALLFLRFFLQIDQEFCDHKLLNECEFFVLPLFSLLFAYIDIDFSVKIPCTL